MSIPFHPDVSEADREKVRIRLNKVTLADVLENVKVNEWIEVGKTVRKRLVSLRFEFLPQREYRWVNNLVLSARSTSHIYVSLGTSTM